jgi:two-component system sensor histidine kinase RstB
VNSIFLRIYGGMLLILIVVSLLALLGIRQVNEFRAETYREDIATGTFRLMADNLAQMEGTERLRALAAWTRLIGVPLQLRSIDQLGLDSRQLAHLGRGRVLVKPSAQSQVKVFSRVDDHTVLTTEIQRITEQLGRATLFLLVDELVRHPESDMPERLQRLRRDKDFGYTLMLTRMREADLDADQRRRLEEFDTVMTLGPDGDSVLLYMKVTDTDWVLRLGPLFQMEDYPRELLLITGLLVLTLSGLLIYLLVRQLERRLITLEAAAMLLSHGNLDARVNAVGQDSVGRVARAFNDMASHLQRLMKIQQEMIGAVSHELRTPIARLRFGLEMVETSKDDKDIVHYVQGMDADLSELDLLVDEILTYARLEQGAPALGMVLLDVPALIDRVVQELAPLNQEVVIEVEDNSYGRAIAVEAEQRYLTRAISNLITNAMRHASSRVRVTCRVVYGRCVVSVEDDGPGIDEHSREKIFTPFMRLDDSRTRASGGYGLGLSIVRRVMYWHGGTARAGKSAALDGADVILEWPQRRG